LTVGLVGPSARWAVTSNVEVGQTTYPVNRGRYGWRGEKGARDSHKEEEIEDWSEMGRRAQDP